MRLAAVSGRRDLNDRPDHRNIPPGAHNSCYPNCALNVDLEEAVEARCHSHWTVGADLPSSPLGAVAGRDCTVEVGDAHCKIHWTDVVDHCTGHLMVGHTHNPFAVVHDHNRCYRMVLGRDCLPNQGVGLAYSRD